MSQKCAVFGCTNTYSTTKLACPMVHFYSFPGRPWEVEKLKVWIKFANRVTTNDLKPWAPSKRSKICSTHFVDNQKSNNPKSPSFNPTIHPIINKSASEISQEGFQSQNVDSDLETVLNNVECIICGTTSIVNTSFSKRHVKSSVVQEDIFNSWKNDCAKATCEVLFDDKSSHFINYFQEADYCYSCQQLVRDMCFTWKHLQLFQNTIDKLSNKIGELIDLNYQKIPDKLNFKVVEEKLSSYLSTNFSQTMPTFSREELVQMIHTVSNKRVQKQYNKTYTLNDCEGITEADSDVEVNSELEENSDLESNSNNPKNQLTEINLGFGETSQVDIEECKEILCESEDEEEYTLIEITPEDSDEVADDTVGVIDKLNPSPSKNTVDLERYHMQFRNNPTIQNPYECNICGKTFSCTKFLKFHHLKMHEDEKNLLFKCSFCDKRFGLQSWLVLHIRESHKKEEPPQSCEICNKTFENSIGLKSHVIRVHKKYEFKCGFCDKSFKSSYRRSAHEELHSQDLELYSKDQQHVQSKLMFECKYCAKGYNTEEELNSHYAESHQGPNPFCCAFCPKIFNNSVDLQRHMKFSHPEPGSLVGKFKCDVCDRFFVSRYNLKIHKLKHGDQSSLLKCEHCPAVFPMPWALNAHLKCHTSERKFVCEVCGKAFKTVHSLKSHSKYHGEKLFKCKFCDKRFFQTNARKTHETIAHTNLKDYICQVCGKAFNVPGNLRGHLRLHESKGEM